jgi:lysozyme
MADDALYKALVQHLIKEGEGFREDQYKDTRGYRTIGYGFNVDDPNTRRVIGPHSQRISQEQADALLPHFISTAERDAQAYAGPGFSKLSPERRAVLVDMAYNLGGPKLGGFKGMRKALLAGDYPGAGRELQDSNYFRQVKTRGVRNRDLIAGKTMARFKQEPK